MRTQESCERGKLGFAHEDGEIARNSNPAPCSKKFEPGPLVLYATQRPMHDHAIVPAVMLDADVAQYAYGMEAERGMQADGVLTSVDSTMYSSSSALARKFNGTSVAPSEAVA